MAIKIKLKGRPRNVATTFCNIDEHILLVNPVSDGIMLGDQPPPASLFLPNKNKVSACLYNYTSDDRPATPKLLSEVCERLSKSA